MPTEDPVSDTVGTVPESTDVTGESESGTVGLGATPEAPLSKDGVRVSILDDGSVTTAPLSDAVGTVPESTDVTGESALETVGLEPLPSEDGDGIAVPGDDWLPSEDPVSDGDVTVMVSTGVTGESEFSPVLALPSEDELG